MTEGPIGPPAREALQGPPTVQRGPSGFPLLELALLLAIFATALVCMLAYMQREARDLRQLRSLSVRERLVNDLLLLSESQVDTPLPAQARSNPRAASSW